MHLLGLGVYPNADHDLKSGQGGGGGPFRVCLFVAAESVAFVECNIVTMPNPLTCFVACNYCIHFIDISLFLKFISTSQILKAS